MKTLLKTTILMLLFAVAAVAQIQVTAPTASVPVSLNYLAPITASDVTGIIAIDLEVAYDPAIIQPSGANFGCSTAGTVAASMLVTCNASAGTLYVSMYGATPLSGGGTILNVNLLAVGSPGQVSPLDFALTLFNGGLAPSYGNNGSIYITKKNRIQ